MTLKKVELSLDRLLATISMPSTDNPALHLLLPAEDVSSIVKVLLAHHLESSNSDFKAEKACSHFLPVNKFAAKIQDHDLYTSTSNTRSSSWSPQSKLSTKSSSNSLLASHSILIVEVSHLFLLAQHKQLTIIGSMLNNKFPQAALIFPSKGEGYKFLYNFLDLLQ